MRTGAVYLVGRPDRLWHRRPALAVHRLWQLRSELERLADRLTLDVGPESTLLYDANNNLVSALFEEHRIAVPLERDVAASRQRRARDRGQALLRSRRRRPPAHRHGGGRQPAGRRDRPGRQHHHAAAGAIDSAEPREELHTQVQGGAFWRGGSRSAMRNAPFSRRISIASISATATTASKRRRIGYFGKTAAELDAVESALLAGLIKGPSFYSPTKAPERARERRDLVLGADARPRHAVASRIAQRRWRCPSPRSSPTQTSRGASDPRRMRGARVLPRGRRATS